MSTKTTVFSVLLLCVLVVTPMAAAEHHAGSDNSGPWMWCDPAFSGHPVPELRGCRAVVKLQYVGSQVPEAALRNCCQQLADVTNEWCRCGALGLMVDKVYEELGVPKGLTPTEAFQGCRKEVMNLMAARLPGVCGVHVPVGTRDVCGFAMYSDA